MKLLKKSQPKPQEVSAKPEASLADRIREIRAESEAIIEAEVQRLRATDAQGLPENWVRADLRLKTGGGCDCRCALKLLEPKQ
jgi:hypothetical protein